MRPPPARGTGGGGFIGNGSTICNGEFTPEPPAPQALDNWRRLGDVVSDIIARRYDLTRQHARVVAEHVFNCTGKEP